MDSVGPAQQPAVDALDGEVFHRVRHDGPVAHIARQQPQLAVAVPEPLDGDAPIHPRNDRLPVQRLGRGLAGHQIAIENAVVDHRIALHAQQKIRLWPEEPAIHLQVALDARPGQDGLAGRHAANQGEVQHVVQQGYGTFGRAGRFPGGRRPLQTNPHRRTRRAGGVNGTGRMDSPHGSGNDAGFPGKRHAAPQHLQPRRQQPDTPRLAGAVPDQPPRRQRLQVLGSTRRTGPAKGGHQFVQGRGQTVGLDVLMQVLQHLLLACGELHGVNYYTDQICLSRGAANITTERAVQVYEPDTLDETMHMHYPDRPDQFPLPSRATLVMTLLLEAESTLTDRYQTTVPETVRRALGLGKRDRIHYVIRPSGEVVLSRAESQQDGDDPVVGAFLEFLANDMAAHPERLRPVDPALLERIHTLTQGVEIDLDQPLSPDDE